ncbi:MAG: amidase [Candidatus Promineifilaceae bacterium]
MSTDPTSLPLIQLVRELRSGDLSPEEYLQQLETRFHEVEPTIHAFLPEEKRFTRLSGEAANLVRRYQDPLSRPPLFCVPIGVKDIFHVTNFETKAGSKVPASVLKGREALSVKMLKNAGALVMGKTVTTEFAYFAPGPTRNPHNYEHTPGGSSSGSAAAVAAGLCPAATGTQTIGSIIRPASYCGVTGFKPSYDRVTRAGIIPLAPSLDHFGLFTNDISCVDLLANVLCPDWQIAFSERLPVLGVPEGPYLQHASEEGLAFFRERCRQLVDAGYTVKSQEIFEDFEEIVSRHRRILAAETAQVQADWYPEYGKLYDERTRELIEEGFGITVRELATDLTGRQQLRRELMSHMDENGIDLWIAPSSVGPADKGLSSTGDPIMNLPWTHAGLPAINLPAGKNEAGLPMGVQVVGRWYGDEMLLEWGAGLERVLTVNRDSM